MLNRRIWLRNGIALPRRANISPSVFSCQSFAKSSLSLSSTLFSLAMEMPLLDTWLAYAPVKNNQEDAAKLYACWYRKEIHITVRHQE